MSLYFGYENKADKVQEELKQYLPLTGGDMNIVFELFKKHISSNRISELFLSNYLRSYIHARLIETLVWEYYTRNDVCLYKLDHAN